VASREAAAASRLGSPTVQNQRDSATRVSCRRVTPLIPVTFLVSAELCQPIPIMRFMVSTDLIQPIPKIFCIDWVTSVDTNKSQPINTVHTPLFRPSITVVMATVPTEISFFEVCFQLSLICFFPFFAMVYIDLDFDFTMISLMDLGLFPCIYILKDISLFSCIYSNRDLDFTFIYSNSSRIIPIYLILIN
jgi:hypothetical protein